MMRAAALVALVLLHRSACASAACSDPQQFIAEGMTPRFMSMLDRTVDFYMCLREACSDSEACVPEMISRCDEPVHVPGYMQGYTRYLNRHRCPKLCGDCSRQRAGSAVAQELRAPCPEGWNYTEGSCFKAYTHVTTDPNDSFVRFRDAKSNCVAVGARLAEVDSPAKNHLAFELFRQRSASASTVHSTTAWIGLRTIVDGDVRNQSHWKWSSRRVLTWSNWGEGDRSRGVFWKSPYYDPLRKGRRSAAVLNYPDTNYGWEAVDHRHWRVPSWICERPAAVQTVTVGNCTDHGLVPIRNVRDCEAAAEGMGFDAPLAFSTSNVPAPEGCYYNRYRFLFFSSAPENAGNGGIFHSMSDPSSAYHDVGKWKLLFGGGVWDIQICFNASAKRTGTTAEESVSQAHWNYPAVDKFRPAPLEKNSNRDSEEILTALCVAYASVLVLLAEQSRRSLSSTLHVFRSLLSRALALFRREAGKDDALQEKVQRALAQRQERLAVLVAGAHLLYRLLRLTIAVLAEERCDVSRTTHAVVIGAQALEVVFAVGLILAEGRCRRMLFRAFVLAIPLSKLLQAGLSRDLLVGETRLYEDLFWRLLLGVAISRPRVVVVNVVYSAGVLVLHWLTVPSGMIILPSQKQGCSILVTSEEWNIINDGWVWMHQHLTSVHMTRHLAGEALWALVRRGGQATTSFQRAAFPEFCVLVVSVFASLLFAKLMESDLKGQLKLQASESFLEAFSEMLDKLCDAVVHLDGNLQLQGISRRFAALLARARSVGFCQHLFEAQEEDRLRRSLQTRGDGKSCTLNVDFKDSFGVKVPCQVFHVELRSFDGQPHYILGINEIGERHGAQGDDGPGPDFWPAGAQHHDPARRAQPEDDVSSSDDLTSGVGSITEGQGLVAAPEPHAPAEQDEQARDGSGSATPDASSADNLSSSNARSREEQEVAPRTVDLSFSDFRIAAVSQRAGALFHGSPVDAFLDGYVDDVEDQNVLYRWQSAAAAALRRGDTTEPLCQAITLRSRPLCWNSPKQGAVKKRRVELEVEPITPPAGGVTNMEAMAMTARIRRVKRSKNPSGEQPSDSSKRSAERNMESSKGDASGAPALITPL